VIEVVVDIGGVIEVVADTEGVIEVVVDTGGVIEAVVGTGGVIGAVMGTGEAVAVEDMERVIKVEGMRGVMEMCLSHKDVVGTSRRVVLWATLTFL
jgi:hydroxyethylthiazole kinase-like sugar kinase family protein